MQNSVPKIDQKNAHQCIHQILDHGLYQIQPINKTLDKNTLSMAYSPGVGAVCMTIKDNPELIDDFTLRGRSVAIITQGRYSQDHHFQLGHMTPILDWCITQAKFYGGVDCYPFILRHSTNLKNTFKDLSNSYSVLVWLDHTKIPDEDIPKDVAFINLEKAIQIAKCRKIQWQKISNIFAYIIKEKIRNGLVSDENLTKGLNFKPNLFKVKEEFFTIFHDDRSLNEHAVQMHKHFQGKIHIETNFFNIDRIKQIFTQENLISFIKKGQLWRGYKKISTILTDGTAILGYGDIGPRAGLPVMQGKSLLFKSLGGTDVVPICINKRQTVQQQIQAILDVASFFKAINLEDITAPQCFSIQKGLSDKNILPVFHDDQHGTAIITLAALINSLKFTQKNVKQCKAIINGAGAAGMTIAKILGSYGFKHVILVDSKGSIYEGREENMNKQKEQVSKVTNKSKFKGPLEQVIKQADVFVGVSVAGALKKEWIKTMAKKPIIFAMANPDPQIGPEDAKEGGAFIYGSGRSDYQNQINNSLVFPGIFRSLHKHNLHAITEQMKLAVAELIAESINGQISQTNIIPNSLDRDVPAKITQGLQKFKNKQ